MCIRDRNIPERLFRVEEESDEVLLSDDSRGTGGVQEAGRGADGSVSERGLGDRIRPVSYTHLDVYKRQEYTKWKSYMTRYRSELAAASATMPELLEDAKKMGLTDGSRPRDLVTREECAVMARAAAKL